MFFARQRTLGPEVSATHKRKAAHQLQTTRKIIEEIKALQAETAALQQQTAANLRETAEVLGAS